MVDPQAVTTLVAVNGNGFVTFQTMVIGTIVTTVVIGVAVAVPVIITQTSQT